MNIAVLGAGSMGQLFAAGLSDCHDVLLMDRNPEKVRQLSENGIRLIEKDGNERIARPGVALMGEEQTPAELVVIFVKSMGTREALEKCRSLIGEQTILLTLQNGGGHEAMLGEYVSAERVLIGTTQHNAAIRADGSVYHGGSGMNYIGSPLGESENAVRVAEAFSAAGFPTEASDNVKAVVWRKLLTNVSLSALTGVFQTEMGFITESPAAWALCEKLVREAVAVAAADGVVFNAEEKIAEVRAVSTGGPKGITSICADLRAGRKTEVDTISGSVVAAARRLHVPAPCHEMMVQLIHAMEDRNESKTK